MLIFSSLDELIFPSVQEQLAHAFLKNIFFEVLKKNMKVPKTKVLNMMDV